MGSEAILDTIKQTVLVYLPHSRVLLFGSQARGSNDNDSDYDVLVITPGRLSTKEKLSFSGKMHKAIVGGYTRTFRFTSL